VINDDVISRQEEEGEEEGDIDEKDSNHTNIEGDISVLLDEIQRLCESVMKINLKDLSGRTVQVKFTPETTLNDFQDLVLSLLTIPKDKQRLIFAGEELNGADRRLVDWGIHDQSSVRLVAHLSPQARRNSIEKGISANFLTNSNQNHLPSVDEQHSNHGLQIQGLTPNSGLTSGGNRVVVYGAFGDDYHLLNCYFGPVNVKILRSTSESLSVCAPAHPPGIVTVCVSDSHTRLISNQVPYIYVDPQTEPTKIAVPNTTCMPHTITAVCKKEVAVTNFSQP